MSGRGDRRVRASRQRTVTVLGAGSWGTTFSLVLADAGHAVRLWSRRPDLAAAISQRRVNPDYLPGRQLPPSITATSDAAEALADAGYVVLAVPSQTLRGNLTQWAPHLPEVPIVSLLKGIELHTGRRMSEVVTEVTGRDPSQVVVISGPNLAREIADRQPSAAVVACSDEATAAEVQAAVATPYFRPYTNRDVVGVEIAGALKNVVALAAGIAEGMGFGDNTRATIITRGLAETMRLGLALGADPTTFSGLAGVGDLVATCSSPLSRNRSFGEQLGRGVDVADVLAGSRQIAEGVRTSESVLELAGRLGVDMPLTAAVVGVVRDHLPLPQLAEALMDRPPRSEHDGLSPAGS
ncbi:MAG: NAD(P)H-dependent glycerol-3-phosphate dehydrogenase [Actinomycetes bacterium]